MVSAPPNENVKGENALYVFNRLLRMATDTDLSTWKQNQVRNFLKHDRIDEILALSDDFGRTILDNACVAGNLLLVKYLLSAGAKLGKPHVTMAIMCSEEHLHILKYMLAHDHKLSTTEVVVGDQEDSMDRMPLLNFCAKKGDVRAIGFLLAYGFKTAESVSESLDRSGNTPLHLVRNKKVAAQILNRSGLSILNKTNLQGQLPIDCLLECYSTIPKSNGFGIAAGYEEELKKTAAFISTLMNHVPRRPSNTPTRTVTPPTLPTRSSLSNSIHRQSSSSHPSSPPCIPPRDVKSFLSRNIISKVTASNSLALLQEQREILKTEVAALQRHRMMDLKQRKPSIKQHQQQQQYLLTLKQQQQTTSPLSIMKATSSVPTSRSSPPSPSAFRVPLTSQNPAIDTAFATECKNPNAVSQSLSLLASALSNQNKNHNKNIMLHQEDLRMRAIAAKMFPQPRFENNALHNLLRSKYC